MLCKKETVEMEDIDNNYYKSFKETVFLINNYIEDTIKSVGEVHKTKDSTATLFYQMWF